LINGGAVRSWAGTATVATPSTSQMFGLDGNDTIAVDESNGAMPAALMFGVRQTTP